MKASTWAALALCAGRAHPSGAAAGGDQCDVVCGAIKSEVSSSEACAKARKSLPRPKIGHICQEAFEKALEFTCVEACQRHGTGRVPENRLSEACDRRRREVPRPVAHKACMDGFNAGFAATTAFIAQRVELPVQVPQTDKEETATLLERQALILEEVAAEFGFSGEVDTTEEQAEQAQNVEVPKLDEAAQGGFSSNVGSAGSTAGMEGRGVDDSGAGEPLREGRDKLEKHASSRTGDSTMIKLGSEFQEVLYAEHVEGFQGASRDRSTESSDHGGPTTIKLGSEYQEVLKAEHVEGFQSASRGRSIISSDEGDPATITLGSEFQEVLKAEHVQGFHSAPEDRKIDNQAVDESTLLAGAAEDKGKVAKGVSSEDNLAVELPKDGRFQEVLTVDHVKAFHNPSSLDKAQTDHGRPGPIVRGSRKGSVPASAAVELEDFVTLELPEPPLSTNGQTVEVLSVKEDQPREMQENEVPALESEGNN